MKKSQLMLKILKGNITATLNQGWKVAHSNRK